MKLHHIRNATLVIEAGDQFILVDPMLGKRGAFQPFAFFRFKARRNPTVPLPDNSDEILEKITHCLITHQHEDHIDKTAENFLKSRNVPVYCSIKDESVFKKKGLNVVATLDYWRKDSFLDGTIMGVPARHGYGFVARPMGNVMGFFIELSGHPSIYISSDTIYTDEVKKVLEEYKPAISVVACGSAQLDIFSPLLMKMDDILQFVEDCSGKVIANHLEALNHCPTTRDELREKLKERNLIDKVKIPEDGETMMF